MRHRLLIATISLAAYSAACAEHGTATAAPAPATTPAPASTTTPAPAPATQGGLAGTLGALASATFGGDNGPCKQIPFATDSPVPEASGAAWLTVDGKLALMVVGDSGNNGAYELLDPDTGMVRESGLLPLGDAGDDLEGLSARGDRVYGLISAGWMRVWQRDGKGFKLVDGPYPIGPVDPSFSKHTHHQGNSPPDGDGMVCDAHKSNCGRNYEGLCLIPPAHAPTAAGACTGFAAAKADGHLYCLVEKDGRFVVDHARSLDVARPGAMADCTFDEAGRLWIGDNTFGLDQVSRVTGWADLATAKVSTFANIGVGFPEVIAVRGDTFYRMSDTGGSPSLMAKFRCQLPAQ